MCARLPYNFRQIHRHIAEYKRLCKLSLYQRINERAADRRADAWRAYQPLSPEQLFDTLDESEYMTVVMRRSNGELASFVRSSNGGAGNLKHYYTVRRPTEMRATLHAQGLLVLDSDFVVIRQDSDKQMRWCIFCREHHEVHNFIHSKHYLNELSFACKQSLKEARQGIWRYSGMSA